MTNYVKKLWSTHPNKYKFIPLSIALEEYWLYCQEVIGDITSRKNCYPRKTNLKQFEDWLKTEI